MASTSSIISLLVPIGILLSAGILLYQTARKRKDHNSTQQAAWRERLKNQPKGLHASGEDSEAFKKHIRNLTDEANALLKRLEHRNSKKND